MTEVRENVTTISKAEGNTEKAVEENESRKAFMSAEEVEDLTFEMNEAAGQYGYDAAEYAELDAKEAPSFQVGYEEWLDDSGLNERLEGLDEEEREEWMLDNHLSLEFFQEAAESTYWITLEERRVDEDYEEEEEEEENEEKEDTYE